MENHHRKNSSGDKFSFPIIPTQDKQFEFEIGCPTPDSPNSPADHLFSNGRLLPHSFPSQPNTPSSTHYYPRSTSRTSSISSKDSLMWSRSNSTNSRSSNCSSARTSTSEASERRLPLRSRSIAGTRKYHANYKPCLAPQNVYSQRWQFITPVLVLKNPNVSHPKKAQKVVQEKRVEKQGRVKTGRSSRFFWRFFRWFFTACRECHSMKTSTRDDVLQLDIESG